MPDPNQSRVVRVFISSTFRDMQAERDYLVKFTFPQLRKLCESRGVTWGEVDLRWGITDEEKAEGKVLPLCLEEIHRCRPYFIGLLGERYGWIPDAIPPEVIDREAWLGEHVDKHKSVTELEILHGVLNNPEMANHAFFYFRDPNYVESIPAEQRQDFAVENSESAEKLRKLKKKIRAARNQRICALREGYVNPEQLGEWILEDFTALIDTLYPKEDVPDALDQEAARHEAYAQNRRLAFIGREDLLRGLDEYAATGGEPLVITGDSGCGKSALLAEWTAQWRKEHPDDLIIQHYIGSTPDSANWMGLVRRIIGELGRAFAISDDLPLQADALRTALNSWTVKAAGSRRVILVLDALNQLAEDGAARQLGWLPVVFPTNFRVVASSLPGESLDVLHKRDWLELNVPLFARTDIAPAALAYFRIFSKTPPKEILAKLESTPAAGNALYLRAVLDELRQFGKHEELNVRAADYLSAPDPRELYERILTRWGHDFGFDLVRRTLRHLWAARHGLSESNWLGLLGSNEGPLPRQSWAPLFLAMEPHLAQRAGLFTFGHDYLRDAVQAGFLPGADDRRTAHLLLADYFERHRIIEVVWQLRAAGERDRLKQHLLDISLFILLRERNENELMGYWVWLGQERTMGQPYIHAFERWVLDSPTDEVFTADKLSAFLYHASLYTEAEPLMRRALALTEQSFGPDHRKVVFRLNNLAQLLEKTNRLAEAEPLMRRALAICESTLGSNHPDVAEVLNNLSFVLGITERQTEAEPLIRRALAIEEKTFGPEHPSVVKSLNALAFLLRDTNRVAEAESLMRRALSIEERSHGPGHPRIAALLTNLASLLGIPDQLPEAESCLRRALAIAERSYGSDHPAVAQVLHHLASFLKRANRFAEAEPPLSRAVAILEKSLGPAHPEVASVLGDIASVLQATNRLPESEPLLRRTLAIEQRSFGLEHTKVLVTTERLASLLKRINRPDEAEPLFRNVAEVSQRSFGPEHGVTVTALNNLAAFLHETNRMAEAEPIYRHIIPILEKNVGPEHLTVANALNNLAGLLVATNRSTEAEPLIRRVVEIFSKSLGPDHPNYGLAVGNLSRLLLDANRLAEAEPLARQALVTFYKMTLTTGHENPQLEAAFNNYTALLDAMGLSREEVLANLHELVPVLFSR